MSHLPEILVLFLTPAALYVVPTLIARRLIRPNRNWFSDAPLLFVLFAAWYFSLVLRRQGGMGNWLLEPALLTAAPVTFWLLSKHPLVAKPKVRTQPIGRLLTLAVLLALSSPLLSQAPARTLAVNFTASADSFRAATEEYREIWVKDGSRIVEAMARVSGLRFEPGPIEVSVYEGTSYSGERRASDAPAGQLSDGDQAWHAGPRARPSPGRRRPLQGRPS